METLTLEQKIAKNNLAFQQRVKAFNKELRKQQKIAQGSGHPQHPDLYKNIQKQLDALK